MDNHIDTRAWEAKGQGIYCGTHMIGCFQSTAPQVAAKFGGPVLDGDANARLAAASHVMLSALYEAYAALDAISGARLTPALRIGNMTTTLGNTRNTVRNAIIRAGGKA
jgi:hypothetical protein